MRDYMARRRREVMPVGDDIVAKPGFNSAGGGRGKGRPKKYLSNADRQAAYRERKAT